MQTLYLKVSKESISKYVIFSGDPWRVEIVKDMLDECKHIGFFREFNTYTGFYKDVPITITSTGIGAPSAAIAMEEMYECGMRVAVRMGTVMGLKNNMLGSFFVPIASMREESTSSTYVPISYPAVADFDLVSCMKEATSIVQRKCIHGISATTDGFYGKVKESRLSKEMSMKHSEFFSELKKYNIKATDMESSCILALASLMNVKACVLGMTTVLENLKESLQGDERTKAEKDLCICALEGIAIYHKKYGDRL